MPFDSLGPDWNGPAPRPGATPEAPPGADAHTAGEGRLDRPALLAALRARSARLDAGADVPDAPLLPELDRDLPGGLPHAALHEILPGEDGTGAEAGAGFAALLMARSGGTAVWIAQGKDPFPTGLARFGLPPSRLILLRAGTAAEALWAAEACLRCPTVSAAVLAGTAPAAEALRRLQLAAETGGGIALLLPGEEDGRGPSPAATRWRVTGGARGLGDPQWNLELLTARPGRARHWSVTWRAAMEALLLDDEGVETAPPRRARR